MVVSISLDCMQLCTCNINLFDKILLPRTNVIAVHSYGYKFTRISSVVNVNTRQPEHLTCVNGTCNCRRATGGGGGGCGRGEVFGTGASVRRRLRSPPFMPPLPTSPPLSPTRHQHDLLYELTLCLSV